MSSSSSLKIVVKDSEAMGDVVLSRSAGGSKLERGLAERLSDINADIDYQVSVERYTGVTDLFEGEITSGSPDIVILTLAGDMERLKSVESPESDVSAVRADIVRAIRRIKSEVGAHIFVTNVSTLDPADPVFNYHGLTEQPWTLRGHRLNLMIIGVSHDEGVSIVDIDRVIAEAGGDGSVEAAARYTTTGCEAVVDEMVRIIEEYGFLDDRPVMEQIGAAAGSGS